MVKDQTMKDKRNAKEKDLNKENDILHPLLHNAPPFKFKPSQNVIYPSKMLRWQRVSFAENKNWNPRKIMPLSQLLSKFAK
jgi:hypothetical protein